MTKPLIKAKESERYPNLFVEKYTKRVFWDNLWDQDPDLVESRGVVKNAAGNVVARPFTKIFNRGENGVDIDRDERCIAVRKINGFMAAVTHLPERNQTIVSTTGSLDSDYAILAEKVIGMRALKYAKSMPDFTFLFEICDPSDPHIITEKYGPYLIGARLIKTHAPYFSRYWHETWLDTLATKMGSKVRRPEWIEGRFSDIVLEAKACKHEGFVVYGQESKTALKLKSPYYLALKAAARIKDITSLDKRRVDEEFYPLIDHLKDIGEVFNGWEEQARLRYIEDFLRGS